MKRFGLGLKITTVFILISALVMVWSFQRQLKDIPKDFFEQIRQQGQKIVCVDRHGRPLHQPYDTEWNVFHYVRLHEIPQFLQQAFIISEDKRFYTHHGIDWIARLNAL
ncbi:MAG: transglycosylase domain-containing protein, partial [Desulfobacterales bacterium]|nr:transglycosylase domain-containing protein [Desulfobacterales bacterium]